MTDILLPERLQASLRESHKFPLNSISATVDSLPYALSALGDKFDSIKPTLFETDSLQWEVVIRDFATDGKVVAKCNAHDLSKLTDFLGIQRDTSRTPSSITAKKKDPRCRFVNLYAVNSRAPLLLTPEMFGELLTYHQVTPNILQFISLFGEQSQVNDLIFSGFSAQPIATRSLDGIAAQGLGRSGKQYQICYNLKCVNLKASHPKDFTLDEWSIRQAVIHHQFDVDGGDTFCKKSPSEYRSFGTPEESFRSTLFAHLMYCFWAREDWRGYIGWLERGVDHESQSAVWGRAAYNRDFKEYTPQDIQNLQIWEEAAGQAIAALEGNIDIISALLEFYQGVVKEKNFKIQGDCAGEVSSFAAQVKAINIQFAMEVKRTQALVKRVSDRRELVIQHLQSQSAFRMEKVSHRMEREQTMMLIITIVTLVYLPATFVSTFFSTDIIKYQGADSPSGSYSETAMMRWLQVTIPLTFLTGLSAWVGRKVLQRGWERENENPRMPSLPPDESRGWFSRVQQTFTQPRPLLPFSEKKRVT
ncbi:hypothetical protein PG996_003836 [Apiospora saccharicola]|uniref:CorA-like transporter domain-containing protein n=1 Tax=Apiospora saccharicola TaxID=335842 RepID=A0ABR1W2F6_9PEZI